MTDDDYTSALETEGRDLIGLAAEGRLRTTLFRENEIQLVMSALARGRSVLLVGPEGVGRSAVVYGLAQRAHDHLRLRELSTAQILSGTRYSGEFESKAEAISKAAVNSRTVLYFDDVWNIPDTGRTSQSDSNLWDAFRHRIAAGELQLLGKVTPDILNQLQEVPGFVSLFEIVKIPPLSKEAIDAIVVAEAERLEVTLDASSCARMIYLCQRFLSAVSGPGPVLRLLEQTRDYQKQKDNVGEPEAVSSDFVEKVFSIYSGLPRFVVSEAATQSVADIRSWFQARLLGQEAAIEAVVDIVTLFKAGLNDPDRPIGTLFFAGPTGVGKTELARLLATFLFGGPRRMLRFDLSEFADYHAFQMLVGDPEKPSRPARLIDPIRANPFQVILFDELEKGHLNVWDVLLQLLDEGRLTSPRGQTVDFRNTIIIVTTNVGAVEAARSGIGFATDESAKVGSGKMREALEATFRPEFLNRFQHLVLFKPLSRDQLKTIARQELKRIVGREGITGRNLIVDVADAVIDKAVDEGIDHRYGARALKRRIQRLVVVPLATFLMERPVEPKSIVKVKLKEGHITVRIVETADSRGYKREREPVKAADGQRYTREELAGISGQIEKDLASLGEKVREGRMRNELQRLDQLRGDAELWHESEQAMSVILESNRLARTISRLDQLHDDVEALKRAVDGAVTRTDFEHVAYRMLHTQARVSTAWRELVKMGREGEQDALVEIVPLTGKGPARDLLFETYRKWAAWRHLKLDMLCEPLTSNEPVFCSIRGDYAYGLLRLEAGHHRVRDKEEHSVVRVRVAPWLERISEIHFTEQVALKMRGQLGGRVRSRIRIKGVNLMLQNERILSKNRDMAVDVAPSWMVAPEPVENVVRRYDLKPFLVRDYLTDTSTGRSDVLMPEKFHELLCQRVDLAAEGGQPG